MAISKKKALRPIATSRLTSKGQATFPARVRKRLHLKPGDMVVFEASDTGPVLVRKGEPLDTDFLTALETTLSEWNSDNDDQAFRDL
jgi:AbrB family looped-hinge helix DNA binding protein